MRGLSWEAEKPYTWSLACRLLCYVTLHSFLHFFKAEHPLVDDSGHCSGTSHQFCTQCLEPCLTQTRYPTSYSSSSSGLSGGILCQSLVNIAGNHLALAKRDRFKLLQSPPGKEFQLLRAEGRRKRRRKVLFIQAQNWLIPLARGKGGLERTLGMKGTNHEVTWCLSMCW